MSFLLLLGIVLVVIAVCILIMAVGAIVKGKTFTSCGCGKITYKGQTIRCQSCPNEEDPSASASE